MNSIFHDEKDGRSASIWSNYRNKGSDHKIAFEDYILKSDKFLLKTSGGQIKSKKLVLLKGRLYVTKKLTSSVGKSENQKPKLKYIDLCDAFIGTKVSAQSSLIDKYVIKLKRGDASLNLITMDKALFLNWHECLKRWAINVDFNTKYKCISKLGSGAFNSVYKVESNETGQTFAAKHFDKKVLLNSAHRIASLKKEIEIFRKISESEYIANFIEVHETKTSVYIIMEHVKGIPLSKTPVKYVEGVSLKEYLKKIKTFVESILHLEKKDIVHLDFKPDNLVWRYPNKSFADNDLILIDFGVSQYTDSVKANSNIYGTPGYIAPEIIADNDSYRHGVLKFTPKCDIFSIGATFYQLITHTSLFNTKKNNDETKKDVLSLNLQCNIDFSL